MSLIHYIVISNNMHGDGRGRRYIGTITFHFSKLIFYSYALTGKAEAKELSGKR